MAASGHRGWYYFDIMLESWTSTNCFRSTVQAIVGVRGILQAYAVDHSTSNKCQSIPITKMVERENIIQRKRGSESGFLIID